MWISKDKYEQMNRNINDLREREFTARKKTEELERKLNHLYTHFGLEEWFTDTKVEPPKFELITKKEAEKRRKKLHNDSPRKFLLKSSMVWETGDQPTDRFFDSAGQLFKAGISSLGAYEGWKR